MLKYILTSAAAAQKDSTKPIDHHTKQPPSQRPDLTALKAVVTVPVMNAIAESPMLPSKQPSLAHNDDLALRALRIIAAQSDIPESELKDDVALADVGVDSLLSLTIAGAFSEDLEVETDPSFFESHPTIGDVTRFFGNLKRSVPVCSPSPERPRSFNQVSISTDKISHSHVETIRMTQEVSSMPSPTPAPDITLNTLHEKALRIIAEESGLKLSELGDEIALVDVGVDSLLSLVIGGRFREELGIDLEPEILLGECETVADLKRRLGGSVAAPTPAHVKVQGPLSNSIFVEEKQEISVSDAPWTTRQTVKSTFDLHAQVSNGTPTRSPSLSGSTSSSAGSFLPVLQIISEETGASVKGLSLDTVLADIGVDSLLSLVIGGRLREELSLDLDLESFLGDQATLRDLETALQAKNNTGSQSPRSSASSVGSSRSSSLDSGCPETPATSLEGEFDFSVKEVKRGQVPAATSVVLQGSPKTCTRALFLFPDGSGSATSYVHLPNIAKDLLVIGLNSPYLKNGDDMRCTWDELVEAYLTEVQRRQPHGPYNFGGWSAGGSLAYRAAQLLIQRGQHVRDLILLDAPPPEGLGELPQHFYDHCESVGLFKPAGSKTSKWLLSHFKAMNRVLSSYYATPLPPSALRKVHVLWVAQSMLDGIDVPPMPTRPGDPKDMQFLTKTRSDFTAGAWRRLFPGGTSVEVHKAEGVNHFTLLVS